MNLHLLFCISFLIRFCLLFKNVELGEENLAELVKAHPVRWHAVFHGADDGDVVEEVEHFEADQDVLIALLHAMHDG